LEVIPIAHLLLLVSHVSEWPIRIMYNSKYVVRIGCLLSYSGFTTQNW